MTPEQIENVYYDEEPEIAWGILLPLAEAGNAVAQFHIGHLCDELSPRDQVQAAAWYLRSFESGYLEGKHWYASFMYHGMGMPQDVDAALVLFRQCAEAGLDASQWTLGQHLLESTDRREEGLSLLKLAAAQGHTSAAELLGGHKR